MVGRPAAGLGLDWGWTMGKTDVLFIQARDTQKGKILANEKRDGR
jgi:hypothetical protein